MKQIFLNLKRFDIPPDMGGVNRIAPVAEWGGHIVRLTQQALLHFPNARFTMYFPEAHILTAAQAKTENSPVHLGCQSVLDADTSIGGNFGAFTTSRTANAAKALGCESTIIGHCEERRYLLGVMGEAGDQEAVSRILNRQLRYAMAAGLHVLFCIGETAEERDDWQTVLRSQLRGSLSDVERSKLTIAYEPVWAIGPGKTPPDKETIQRIASFIREETQGLPVVYGGGLKLDNASMLASIPEIDGGLIALTRFQGEIGFYPDEYLAIIKTYMREVPK